MYPKLSSCKFVFRGRENAVHLLLLEGPPLKEFSPLSMCSASHTVPCKSSLRTVSPLVHRSLLSALGLSEAYIFLCTSVQKWVGHYFRHVSYLDFLILCNCFLTSFSSWLIVTERSSVFMSLETYTLVSCQKLQLKYPTIKTSLKS